MQATLTLDTHQFDQTADKAQARLDALAKQTAGVEQGRGGSTTINARGESVQMQTLIDRLTQVEQLNLRLTQQTSKGNTPIANNPLAQQGGLAPVLDNVNRAAARSQQADTQLASTIAQGLTTKASLTIKAANDLGAQITAASAAHVPSDGRNWLGGGPTATVQPPSGTNLPAPTSTVNSTPKVAAPPAEKPDVIWDGEQFVEGTYVEPKTGPLSRGPSTAVTPPKTADTVVEPTGQPVAGFDIEKLKARRKKLWGKYTEWTDVPQGTRNDIKELDELIKNEGRPAPPPPGFGAGAGFGSNLSWAEEQAAAFDKKKLPGTLASGITSDVGAISKAKLPSVVTDPSPIPADALPAMGTGKTVGAGFKTANMAGTAGMSAREQIAAGEAAISGEGLTPEQQAAIERLASSEDVIDRKGPGAAKELQARVASILGPNATIAQQIAAANSMQAADAAASKQVVDVAKQTTPEAQEQQAIATERALIRQAQGKSHHPLDALIAKRHELEGTEDTDDPDDPGPGNRPESRGRGRAVSYLKYQALNTEGGAIASAFASAVSPGMGSNLAMTAMAGFAAPIVAATAAATAFGLVLHSAAESVTEYERQRFMFNEEVRGGSLGAGGVNEGFVSQQADRMRRLGVGSTQQMGLMEGITRFTEDPGEIRRIQERAMDFARAKGITPEQSQQMFLGASQGQAGAFHEFMPNVYQGDTFEYVMSQTARFSGAAERYKDTPAGKQEGLKTEWDEMTLQLGESMLPVISGLTEGATAMVPVISGVVTVLGTLTGGFIDMARVIMLPIDAIGRLIPGLDGFWDTIGRGAGVVAENSDKLFEFLQKRLNPSEMEKVTGLSQNAKGDWGTYLSDGNAVNPAKSYDEQVAFFMKANPDFGVNAFSPPAEGAAEGWFRTRYPDLPALQAGIAGNEFDAGGKHVADVGTGTPEESDELTKKLANTSTSQVTAMKMIEQEVSLTLSAVGGVQDVFAKLTTFRVDFSRVQGNLDNLEESIRFLQEFWVKTAINLKTGITQHDYDLTNTWLTMVNNMLTMMSGAAKTFQEVYVASSMIPSDGQLMEVMTKSNNLFLRAHELAEIAYEGAGIEEGKLDMAQLGGWADTMGKLIGVMSGGAEMLNKVRDVRIPSEGEITGFVTALKNTVTAMANGIAEIMEECTPTSVNLTTSSIWATTALPLMALATQTTEMFSKMRGLRIPTEGEITAFSESQDHLMDLMIAMAGKSTSKKPRAPFIEAQTGEDPLLQNAGKYAEQAKKLIEVAGAATTVFASMRGLHVPSPEQVTATINRAEGVIEGVVALSKVGADTPGGTRNLANESIYAEQAKSLVDLVGSAVGVFTSMRGMHIPSKEQQEATVTAAGDMVNSLAKFGGDGSALIQAGLWATDAIKVVGVLQGATGVFTAMRGMHVPSKTAMQAFITGLNTILTDAMPMLTSWSDAMIVKAGQWAAGVGPLVSVLQSGTGVFTAMRGMHVPSKASMQAFVAGLNTILTAEMPLMAKWSDAMIVKAGEWAAGLGPVVTVLSGGASLFHEMRNMYVPSKAAMMAFVTGLNTILTAEMPLMAKWSDEMIVKAGQWAAGLGPVVTTLAAGAGLLKELRHLHEPSLKQVRDFREMLGLVLHEFTSATTEWDHTALDKAKDWGEKMGPFVSTLTAGVATLQGIRDLREPSVRAITEFRDIFGVLTVNLMEEAAKYGYVAVDRAKETGEAMSAVYDAASTSVDVLSKLHNLIDPSKAAVDKFLGNQIYMTDAFMKAAQKYGPDMTASAIEYGEATKSAMDALNASANMMLTLPNVALIPDDMLDGFFENMDNIIVQFHERGEQWAKDMRFDRANLTVDISTEMDAVVKAIDVFNKLGLVRFDYTGPINSLFDNMTTVITTMASRAKDWKSSMSEETHKTALMVAEEMDTINKAIEPMTKMELAARVSPNIVHAVIDNLRVSVREFATLADMPELKAENAANITGLAGLVNDVAGSIKNIAEAVAAASVPSANMAGSNVNQWMNDIFLKSAAIGPGAVPLGTVNARSSGGMGGGNTYTDCLIINGNVEDQGEEIGEFVRKYTRQSTVKQGGLPVNTKSRG